MSILKSNEIVLPTLYKLSSTGKIMTWSVWVILNEDGTGTISIYHGQKYGKLQQKQELVTKGKNAGKKNETTAHEQAHLKAQSKWNKQIDKGYVEDEDRALKGEADCPPKPMLAQSFDKYADKINYPAYMQPKLDGIRCLAVVKEDGVKLYSRSGKEFTSVPHINAEIASLFSPGDIIDGELYSHDFKEDFEKIVSMVRSEKPQKDNLLVEFHVYDFVSKDQRFGVRINNLETLKESSHLIPVETRVIYTKDEIKFLHDQWVEQGYEGAMVRNGGGFYEMDKRSYNLQKVKIFKELEFVNCLEHNLKLENNAGLDIPGADISVRNSVDNEGQETQLFKIALVCDAGDGNFFKAPMEGSQDRIRELIESPTLWQGKFITVKFFSYTGKSNVPRFPIGKTIRDYE